MAAARDHATLAVAYLPILSPMPSQCLAMPPPGSGRRPRLPLIEENV